MTILSQVVSPIKALAQTVKRGLDIVSEATQNLAFKQVPDVLSNIRQKVSSNVTLSRAGQALPYLPLFAFPNLFYNRIPHLLSQYQRNQHNKQFTRRYNAALNNPSPVNIGRVDQHYFNYVDTFGRNPALVTEPFANKKGFSATWMALTQPVSQLAQTPVKMPLSSTLSRHYPVLFTGK